MATSDGPIEIDSVTLTVRDLPLIAEFYERVVGLHRLGADGESARLGIDGRTLVHLQGDRHARIRGPREAGLFHTAFLLPSRASLGGWLRHAAGAGVRLDGASDHVVSEALYLDDPEGNGIEVYADRPRAEWQHDRDMVVMRTDPLDLDALGAAATAPWDGAPLRTVIGHVHLKAGDLALAEPFWTAMMGLEIRARYPSATFYSSGGYHHHIATNVWRSPRAPPLTEGGTGIAEVALRAAPAEFAAIAGRTGHEADGSSLAIADPSGIALRVLRKDG